jgi:diguanylate cyclase (GGDEF)-like protein/PAS domain S-box-containing protein
MKGREITCLPMQIGNRLQKLLKIYDRDDDDLFVTDLVVDSSALLSYLLGEDQVVSVLGDGGRPLYLARSRDLLGLREAFDGIEPARSASEPTLLQNLVPTDRSKVIGQVIDLYAGRITEITTKVRALHQDGTLRIFDLTINDARTITGIGGLVLRAIDVTKVVESQTLRHELASAEEFCQELALRLESLPVDRLQESIAGILAEMAGWNAATDVRLEAIIDTQHYVWEWCQRGTIHAGQVSEDRHRPITDSGEVFVNVYGPDPPSSGLELPLYPAFWERGCRVFSETEASTNRDHSVRLILAWGEVHDREINRSALEVSKYARILGAQIDRLATHWDNQAQERRFETMVSQLSDVLVIWKLDGTISYATPSILAITGFTPEELYEQGSSAVPGLEQNLMNSIANLTPGEATSVQQVEFKSLDGRRHVAETVTVNLLNDPLVNGYLTTGRDVTDRIEEHERRQRKDQLSTAIARISNRFVNGTERTFDLNLRRALEDLGAYVGSDRVLLWQPRPDGLFTVTHEKARQGTRNLGHLIPPVSVEDLNRIFPNFSDGEVRVALHDGANAEFVAAIEVPGPTRLGATLICAMYADGVLIGLLTMSSIIDDQGSIPFLDELLNDETKIALRTVAELLTNILAREATAQALAYHAAHDALTGLANRRQLLEHCDRLLGVARENRSGIALMFLDLDDFKVVNDTLGHEVGDQLLVEVARVLRQLAEPGDVVSRLGGDEFVIVRETRGPGASASSWGHRLRAELTTPFTLNGHVIQVQTSIGAIAAEAQPLLGDHPALNDLGLDGLTSSEMLRKADIAMYRSKSEGGNHFKLFTAQMEASTRRRFELLAELRTALTIGHLELAYQPVLDIATGRIQGCEALVRWFHPTQGMIAPSEFIPLAESSGLISELGAWVIDQAASDVGGWIRNGHVGSDFWVAVNVSAVQMTDLSLVDLIVDACRREGIAHHQFSIELTESTLINRDKVVPTLIALRERGISASVDDFGTGFSSLSYLRHLPLETLKIDRSFISEIESDARDLAMVRALVALAHELGLSVVAEGIETEGQLRLLNDMGCESGQGWLFSKAIPSEEFVRFHAERSARQRVCP